VTSALLLLALACSGGKDPADTGGAPPSDSQPADSAPPGDSDSGAVGGYDTAPDGETGGDSGDTAPPDDGACPDLRPALAGCTAPWASTRAGAPQAAGTDTFDGSGDLVRGELDSDADGTIDAVNESIYDADGLALEQKTTLTGDDEPFTWILYTRRDDGQLESARTVRSAGEDADDWTRYEYSGDDRLSRITWDRGNDGKIEQVCEVTWADTGEGLTATWACTSDKQLSGQQFVYDDRDLPTVQRFDDFGTGAWNRVRENTYSDDCLLTDQLTTLDRDAYEGPIYDTSTRTLTYDDQRRLLRDDSTSVDETGKRPDLETTWARSYDCPQ
jgi:hypothetical protein